METLIAIPCAYTMADPPASSGRALLSRLLWEWCVMHHGLSAEDIVRALTPVRDADEERDIDISATERQVAFATRLLGVALADGVIATFARPFGGGRPVPLDASVWELDDFRPRFRTSAIDPAHPFDHSAAPTHWIFVDADAAERVVRASMGERIEDRPAATPTAPARFEPYAEIAPILPRRSEDRLIRRPEVERLTGLPRSTIYARIKEGRFPKQVSPEGNMALWRESEVQAWVADPQ